MPTVNASSTPSPVATSVPAPRKPDAVAAPAPTVAADSLKLSSNVVDTALAAAKASAKAGDLKSATSTLRAALQSPNLDYAGTLAIAQCATEQAKAVANSWFGSKSDTLALGAVAREALGAAIPKLGTPAQATRWSEVNTALYYAVHKADTKFVDENKSEAQQKQLALREQAVAVELAKRMTGPADLPAALKAIPGTSNDSSQFTKAIRAAAFDRAIATATTLGEMRAIYTQLFTTNDVIREDNPEQVKAFIQRADTMPDAFELKQVAQMRAVQAGTGSVDNSGYRESSSPQAGSHFDDAVAVNMFAGSLLGTFK